MFVGLLEAIVTLVTARSVGRHYNAMTHRVDFSIAAGPKPVIGVISESP